MRFANDQQERIDTAPPGFAAGFGCKPDGNALSVRKRVWRFVLLILIVLGAASEAFGGNRAGVGVPAFGRVVVVVFENKGYSEVIGSAAAPTFNNLARRYALLTNYTGVAHPSLPNYLALVSGSTDGITSDCTDCTVAARNLADTLGAASRSWKTYAEGLPSPGFTGADAGRYAKKHEPFVYFRSVLSRPARLAGRSADSIRGRPGETISPRLLARHPRSLPRHARLFRRSRRCLARVVPAASLEEPSDENRCRLRRLRRGFP